MTKITQKEKFKCVIWLDKNKENLAKLTLIQIKDLCTKELAISMNKATLRGYLENAEIPYQKGHGAHKNLSPKQAKILQAQIHTIALALKEYSEDILDEVHPGIKAICENTFPEYYQAKKGEKL